MSEGRLLGGIELYKLTKTDWKPDSLVLETMKFQ